MDYKVHQTAASGQTIFCPMLPPDGHFTLGGLFTFNPGIKENFHGLEFFGFRVCGLQGDDIMVTLTSVPYMAAGPKRSPKNVGLWTMGSVEMHGLQV